VAALERDCCVTPVLDFHEAMALEAHRENAWISDEPYANPGTIIDFD